MLRFVLFLQIVTKKSVCIKERPRAEEEICSKDTNSQDKDDTDKTKKKKIKKVGFLFLLKRLLTTCLLSYTDVDKIPCDFRVPCVNFFFSVSVISALKRTLFRCKMFFSCSQS